MPGRTLAKPSGIPRICSLVAVLEGMGLSTKMGILGKTKERCMARKKLVIFDPKEIVLTEARHVAGELMHVNDSAQVGRW
jgi:hypothetical protein